MNLRGNRKLIAFGLAFASISTLSFAGKISSEAFLVVASAALGGFFTANVINNKTGTTTQSK